MSNTIQRNSNFELLRVVAMLMIVLHHFMVHGVFSYWHEQSSVIEYFNNFMAIFLSTGGKVGVAVFVLLTGYFGCVKNFKLVKWFDVWFKMWLISTLIWLLWFFIEPHRALQLTRSSLMPFSNNAYWFVRCWLLLYLFSPFLNLIFVHCKKNYIRFYLAFFTLILVILPSFFDCQVTSSFVIFFMYLYILGGAIRLDIIHFNAKICFIGLLIAFINVFYGIYHVLDQDDINLKVANIYFGLTSFYVLIVSLSLFYLFSRLTLKQSTIINLVSASMFSVYLIHDNNLVRPYLWHNLLKVHQFMPSVYFVLVAILICFLIFTVCVILDKIIIFCITPLMPKLDGYIAKIRFNFDINIRFDVGKLFGFIICAWVLFSLVKPLFLWRSIELDFSVQTLEDCEICLFYQDQKHQKLTDEKFVCSIIKKGSSHEKIKFNAEQIYKLRIDFIRPYQVRIADLTLKGKKKTLLPIKDFAFYQNAVTEGESIILNAPDETISLVYQESLKFKGKKQANITLLFLLIAICAIILYRQRCFVLPIDNH